MCKFLPTRSLSPAFLQLNIKNTEENKTPRTSTKKIYNHIYIPYALRNLKNTYIRYDTRGVNLPILMSPIGLPNLRPTSRNPPVSWSSTGQLEPGDERLKKKWGHQI